MSKTTLVEAIQASYKFEGESLILGAVKDTNGVYKDGIIQAPLSTLNRHGLVAGATGTGKTKTIQMMVEQLSKAGVPSMVLDIKGDFSGISQAGEINDKIKTRSESIGMKWEATAMPCEFMTISTQNGVRLRATVSEFGPVLFSKILDLNDIQSGAVSSVFKYCDDKGLLLLDLADFKSALNYMADQGKDEIAKDFGQISTTSASTIIRKVVELEQQGADKFFGEKSFDVEDLVRKDSRGYGFINILRVSDLQQYPKLFSTFMLQLLSEIYAKFPEEGDVAKPKLMLFIDEAHLIFDNASKTLLDQINTVIKLIRSKGIGIFFITQNPIDIPDSVLGQLGMKIQHALRAFTANDRKAIKLAAQNYPETDFYKTEDDITTLGIGEAFVTVLSERGAPTELAWTMMRPPESRMDTITDSELNDAVKQSDLTGKYNEEMNRESAYELLTSKVDQMQKQADQSVDAKQPGSSAKHPDNGGIIQDLSKNTMVRQIGRSVMSQLTRSLLGALGIGRR
jgi:uncharacterized protein